MTRAIAYVRVSTEKQADHGVSLEAQQKKIFSYADVYELELIDTVVDAGVSAKSLDRPGLKRALEMLKRGDAEALVVVKLDRLTRSVADLGVLVEQHFQKAALMSVSEQIDTRSAAGRLVLNVLGSVCQWEREAIGERTSAAMKHKQEKGEFIGGIPPYGFSVADDGVTLVEVESEQAVIRAAKTYKQENPRISLRAISAHLEDAGHRTRKGRPFASEQVRRMLAA